MDRYIYAYDFEDVDEEVFLRVHSLPEIISATEREAFESMGPAERRELALDAVVTALQSIVATRDVLPKGDDPERISASGFVHLSPLQAMKLQLFKVYAANCASIADFSRRIGKHETAARRLLNLRHNSSVAEIEEALGTFGKELVHQWAIVQDSTRPFSLGRKTRRESVQ